MSLSLGFRRGRSFQVGPERLESRTLLSAVAGGEIVQLGEVVRPEVTQVPLRRITSAVAEAPGFQIEVRFVGSMSDSQRAAFTTAANRWQQIITGDIPDVNFNGTLIDDIRIDASAPSIDGPGGILGAAGPTAVRTDGSWLPVLGEMRFDSADLLDLEADGQLVQVILHEMGHVLGLGTLWDPGFKNLVSGAGGPDPRYTGPAALAEYNNLFSRQETSIPVEDTGGDGTADSHWRDSVFHNELMTGYLDTRGRGNPLSRVTAAQFIDMGYNGVVVSAADQYTPSALVVSPNPVNVGGTLTLTANGFSDPGSSTARVSFYRESNGVAGLQSSDTLLGNDNSGANGYSWTVSTTGLVPGTYTYHARAVDTDNFLSNVVSATSTVQVAASRTPGVPDLLAAFDTGDSSTDNVTRLDNSAPGSVLQFTVADTVAGATVTLLADGVPVGVAVATGTTTTVTTTGVADLADGSRSITARQLEPGKPESPASAGVTLVVDTAAPGVSDAAFLFQSSPHRLAYTFSESVQASLAAADLTVRDLATNGSVAAGAPAYTAGTNVATFAFPGALANANYRATLAAAGVTDAAGNAVAADHLLTFFALTGDLNRDRRVDGNDFAMLASNFGKSGQSYGTGDLNGDGKVDASDFALLAGNFGKSLGAALVAEPSSSALVSAAAAATAPAAAVAQAPVPATAPAGPVRRAAPPQPKRQPPPATKPVLSPLRRHAARR